MVSQVRRSKVLWKDRNKRQVKGMGVPGHQVRH